MSVILHGRVPNEERQQLRHYLNDNIDEFREVVLFRLAKISIYYLSNSRRYVLELLKVSIKLIHRMAASIDYF